MTTRYIPHIIYTVAITSISTHLLWHRTEAEDQRRHVSAYISLLESTVDCMRAGERIPEREFERIRKFDRNADELERDRMLARGVKMEEERERIGWREALFGSRVGESKVREEYDRKDLEKVRKEIEESTS